MASGPWSIHYYFVEIMGRGFFVLLVYVALLGFRETRRPAGRGAGPNAKCPCGSGRKFKRCCGAGRHAAAA